MADMSKETKTEEELFNEEVDKMNAEDGVQEEEKPVVEEPVEKEEVIEEVVEEETPEIDLEALQKELDETKAAAEKFQKESQTNEQRWKSLQGQLKDRQEQQKEDKTQETEGNIDALYQKLQGAHDDADYGLVVKIQQEIHKEHMKNFSEQFEEKARSISSEETQKERYDRTLSEIEKQYDVLNRDSEDYDQNLVDDVIHHTKAFRFDGLKDYDALQKAVNLVMPSKLKELGESKDAEKLSKQAVDGAVPKSKPSKQPKGKNLPAEDDEEGWFNYYSKQLETEGF